MLVDAQGLLPASAFEVAVITPAHTESIRELGLREALGFALLGEPTTEKTFCHDTKRSPKLLD